jgi:hypothetical protein
MSSSLGMLMYGLYGQSVLRKLGATICHISFEIEYIKASAQN